MNIWDSGTAAETVALEDGAKAVVRRRNNNSVRTAMGFTAGTHSWTVDVDVGARIGLVGETFDRWTQAGDAIGNVGEDSTGILFMRHAPTDMVRLGRYSGLGAKQADDEGPLSVPFKDEKKEGVTVTITVDRGARTFTVVSCAMLDGAMAPRGQPILVWTELPPEGVELFFAASVYCENSKVAILAHEEMGADVAVPVAEASEVPDEEPVTVTSSITPAAPPPAAPLGGDADDSSSDDNDDE